MNNQSSIFLRRDHKLKALGGIRYASNSLSSKNQNRKLDKPFYLSRNHFKEKIISGLQDFDFKTDKIEKTTKYSSPPSPQVKSPRVTRFKLCTSKNVCVFSNLKKVETQQKPSQNLIVNKNSKLSQTNRLDSTRNSTQNQKPSPQLKRSKIQDIFRTSVTKIKMRKISSSLNCRSQVRGSQKIFDRWDNEDIRKDHDIIFYK